jgi:hypothetical protein
VRRLRALAALSADRWEGVLSPGSEPLGGGDLVSCAPVMAAREDSAGEGPEVEEAAVGLATGEDDGDDGVRVGSVLALPAATRRGLATTPVEPPSVQLSPLEAWVGPFVPRPQLGLAAFAGLDEPRTAQGMAPALGEEDDQPQHHDGCETVGLGLAARHGG